jgi:hypothetical protein
MTFQELSNICSFIKEQGKSEYVLFMSEKEYFVMMQQAWMTDNYPVPKEINDNKCIAVISYCDVTLYIVDPALLAAMQ